MARTFDAPVDTAEIGGAYALIGPKGTVKVGKIADIVPLGRHDRTRVVLVVKHGDSEFKFRHELIGTYPAPLAPVPDLRR